jgi:hypothetical protein
MDNFALNISIDRKMSSYRDLWTSKQAETVGDRAKASKKLEQLTATLLLNWRSFAYGAGMAEVIAIGPNNALEHFTTSGGYTAALEIAPRVMQVLAKRVPQIVNVEGLRQDLEQEAIRIGADLIDARDKANESFELSADQAWDEHLNVPAFVMYVWGTMRLVYVGVYNAYDDFVRQCVRVICNLRPDEELTHNDARIKEVLLGKFGKQVWDECWAGPKISEIKEIRHSLSHCCGRPTIKLREWLDQGRFELDVLDDIIQIWPENIHKEYKSLAPCVKKLIDTAIKLPCFAW